MGKHAERGLRRGQGYTERRVSLDGAVSYVARWREGGKLRARTFTDPDPDVALELAEAHCREMSKAVRSGRYVPPSDLTVEDVVNQYLERGEARWEPNTYATYTQRTRACILDQIGKLRVRELTTPRAQHWVDALHRDNWRPNTIQGAVTVLSGAMAEAVRHQVIAANPVKGVSLPRIERSKHQTWTGAQVARVLAHVATEPMWHALYRLALMTGMRPGELRAIHWDDVDLERGTVTVRRTMTRDRRGRPTLGDATKTDDARVIAIPAACVAALRSWRAEQNRIRLAAVEWKKQGYVFAGRSGGWLAQSSWQRRHRRICERAGVPVITHHEMRHTAATILMESGAHLKVVSEILGHRKVQTTLDLYSHVSVSLQRATTDALEDRLDRLTLDATTAGGETSESG
jgi:integrase